MFNTLKEENQIKIVKIAAGILLAGIYAFTSMDGMLLIMSAFLLGLPLEQVLARTKKD